MAQNDKPPMQPPSIFTSLIRWIDSEAGTAPLSDNGDRKVDWFRVLPFVARHVACLLVLFSWTGMIRDLRPLPDNLRLKVSL